MSVFRPSPVIDARDLQGAQGFTQAPGGWLGPPTNQFRGNVGDFVASPLRNAPFGGNIFGPGQIPGSQAILPAGGFQGGGGGGGNQGGGDQGGGGDQTEAQPDQRETERALKRRKGDPDKKYRRPEKAHERVKSKNAAHAPKHLGIKGMDQEGKNNTAQNSDPSALPNSQIPNLGGIPQDISAAIPAMQELLQNIPNEILGQFLSQLPGPLQSLIPPGLIPGLGGNGAFNLNSLLSLAGSGALGGVGNALFNQILTSVGLPVEALQLLNPAAISQLGAGLGQVSSLGALAQLMSNVQMASGVSARNSGPIDPAILNQLMGSMLQANGVPVQGLANFANIVGSLANSPLGDILNSAMAGTNGVGQPVIPSNLSNPPSALLNGLGREIPQQLLQNLLNVNQLTSMLPQQLQAVLPALGGEVNNLISQFANSNPERVPGSNVGRGDQGSSKPKKKEAQNDGKTEKGMHELDYAQFLSPSFDLFQLSMGSGVEPGNGKIYKKETEIDEVIKNLSSLAVNVLEPIREAYPTMVIHAGFTESGEHAKGKAVDIGFNVSPTRLMEIADWVRKNVPYKELQMNFSKKGWLHIVYDGSSSGGGGVTSSSPAGVESGLVNRFG